MVSDRSTARGADLPLLLSIVIPVHNAGETLPALCDQLAAACAEFAFDHEIILVDDASIDASPAILQAFSQQLPTVRLHRLDRNSGQAIAVATGVSMALGSRVVVMDDDLQHPPEHIQALLDAQIRAGGNSLAIAVPVRRRREWWRSALGRTANMFSNLLLQKKLPLRMTSFCCFSRDLADELSKLIHTGGPWLVLLVQHTDRTVTVPLELQHSARRKSRYTFKSLTKLFISRTLYFSLARIAICGVLSGGLAVWCLLRLARQPGFWWASAATATLFIFVVSVFLAWSLLSRRKILNRMSAQ